MPLTPEEELKVAKVLAGNSGAQTTSILEDPELGLTPEQRLRVASIMGSDPDSGNAYETQEELKKFSWAALGLGPVYYYKMKDWPFFWASLLASIFVYTIVLYIPLAFFARRRAWERAAERNFSQFIRNQRSLDRNGIISGILGTVFLFLALRWITSSLESTLGTTDPNSLLQQVNQNTSELNGLQDQ